MIVLDAAFLGNPAEAHAYLQEALSFPDWYGRNLDALYDCLTDLDETEIRFIHTENAELYFQAVLRVFEDAAVANRHLHIWQEADEDE